MIRRFYFSEEEAAIEAAAKVMEFMPVEFTPYDEQYGATAHITCYGERSHDAFLEECMISAGAEA